MGGTRSRTLAVVPCAVHKSLYSAAFCETVTLGIAFGIAAAAAGGLRKGSIPFG